MKTVFVLFDSLNRQALRCYNPQAQPTPAFDRLAQQGIVFDNHYVGSLPCMPARRDILTGRLNFLHRSWGPVEPFDTCFPTRLHEQGIYTHLISDHYHYWEEGGCGYHNQFSSAEFVRGQERDLWKAMVEPPTQRFRERYHAMLSDVDRRKPNMVNREFIKDEADYPIAQCIDLANEFIDQNHGADNWFLQLELFDPHEPFTAPERFRKNLPTDYNGRVLDWPLYDKLDLTDVEAKELQANYQAIVSMCDYQLGRLLDTFDRYALWDSTTLVLTTDHGFMLGEHGWWGKNVMPVYDPIAHIPLIICHPQHAARQDNRRSQLTQCLDLTATFLDLHGVATNSQPVNGISLLPALNSPCHTRDYALYGIFGGALNITDGHRTYFRYPVNTDNTLYEYTLMPVHPASYFTEAEFAGAELIHDQPFSNGFPVLKLNALNDARRPPMQGGALADANTVLFNLQHDPSQLHPLNDSTQKYESALERTLHENHAPHELFTRFGFTSPAP